jgi:hypothetical protein
MVAAHHAQIIDVPNRAASGQTPRLVINIHS